MVDAVVEAFKAAGFEHLGDSTGGEMPDGPTILDGAKPEDTPAAEQPKPGEEPAPDAGKPNPEDSKPGQPAGEQPAEQPKPEPEPKPQPSFNWLERSAGKYKDEDEVLAALQEKDSALEELAPATEEIKLLNNWIKKGGTKESFNQIYSVDPETAKPLDLLTAKYRLENPGGGETDEEIQADLMDTYKLDPDAQYTETARKAAEVRMNRDVTKAKDLLAKEREKIAKGPDRAAAYNAEEHIKPFVPIIKETVSNFKTINIPIGEKGEKFEFALPETTSKELPGYLEGEVKRTGMKMTDKTPEELANMAVNFAFLKNGVNIIKAFGEKRATEVHNEWISGAHNPSAQNKGGDQDPRQKDTRSEGDKMAEVIAKAEGINYAPGMYSRTPSKV